MKELNVKERNETITKIIEILTNTRIFQSLSRHYPIEVFQHDNIAINRMQLQRRNGALIDIRDAPINPANFKTPLAAVQYCETLLDFVYWAFIMGLGERRFIK